MIERRRLIGMAAAYGLAVPSGATAQRTEELPRVAFVFNTAPLADMTGPEPVHPGARQFVHGLRELGYVEGRNIVIEYRSAEGRPERMPALIRELVALKVEVIVAYGPAAEEARRGTGSIPIVALIDDPDSVGLVSTLARPGGNVTGVSLSAGPEIHGKRLQLLKEAAPKCVRFAFVDTSFIDRQTTPGAYVRRREVEAAATQLGVTMIAVGIDKPEDADQAFAVMTRERADALTVTNSPANFGLWRNIVDFAARRRLPAIYENRLYTEGGGLMSYGTVDQQYRRLATYVDKILKGAKPGDLPIEQPMRFELVINMKTAKAVGLAMPYSLLVRADEVIR